MSELKPHVQRMVDELADLEDKVSKLDAFIESNPVYETLSDTEQHLLCAQTCAMSTYINILKLRIKLA